MCATCGCSNDGGVRLDGVPVHDHDNVHDHEGVHDHDKVHDHGVVVSLEQRVLAKNDHLAGHNRE